MSDPVTLGDVEAAARRIAPHAHRTPVLTCSTIDDLCGARVHFKCENFQKVGAFKFRGACNTVMSLGDEELARGVVTHSSGNHGAAVALAARMRGAKAWVVVPANAKRTKRAAVAGYGAEVIDCEPTQEGREQTVAALVERTGATLVHPYDDPRVIAGQGTAALELLEQVPALDALIAPVGGGLFSGACVTVSALRPGTLLLGAEPEEADDAACSLRAGRRIPRASTRTIADGLRTNIGELTFPIIKAHAHDIATVSEQAIRDATRLVWERMKIVIEPSCGVAVAVLLERRGELAGREVGVILTGGNVDLDDLPW